MEDGNRNRRQTAGRTLAALIGIPLVGTLAAQTGEPPTPVTPTPDDPGAVAGAVTPTATTPAARTVVRQTILDSLKMMRRKPAQIEIRCAMCYEMAARPPDVGFTCPGCGQVATFSRDATAGRLAAAWTTISRSLEHLPFPATCDAKRLCASCSQGQPAALVFSIPCLGCGTGTGWTATTPEEIGPVEWLYLQHPVTRLDGNALNLWGDASNPEVQLKLASGAAYIHRTLFCPKCQQKHPLD